MCFPEPHDRSPIRRTLGGGAHAALYLCIPVEPAGSFSSAGLFPQLRSLRGNHPTPTCHEAPGPDVNLNGHAQPRHDVSPEGPGRLGQRGRAARIRRAIPPDLRSPSAWLRDTKKRNRTLDEDGLLIDFDDLSHRREAARALMEEALCEMDEQCPAAGKDRSSGTIPFSKRQRPAE
jgi:hypothetical protein